MRAVGSRAFGMKRKNDEKASARAQARWERVRSFVLEFLKCLSKDGKAKILEDKYWLEAVDETHRYGTNLRLFFDVWNESESSESSFFSWLNQGEGKDVDLKKCPNKDLGEQCVRYVKPEEREKYEVIVEDGKLVYEKSRVYVDNTKGKGVIYVLSCSKRLFVGEKKKGVFHHSSFLSGAPVLAAGFLGVSNGTLKAVSAQSGHYRPTEENLKQIIELFKEKRVDLSNVKILVPRPRRINQCEYRVFQL